MPTIRWPTSSTRQAVKYELRPILVVLGLALSAGGGSSAPILPGATAPDFEGKDTNGARHCLSDYKGRFVVLEWVNHASPYVQPLYDTGKAQTLQKTYAAKGVVWLSVNSAAKESNAYTSPAEANRLTTEKGAAPTAVLIDPEGAIGRLYGIRVTPEVVVVGREGKVLCRGAFDDASSRDPRDIEDAMNYVQVFLDAAMAGEKAEDAEPSNHPRGTPVPYKANPGAPRASAASP
jgi:hypothetical protein